MQALAEAKTNRSRYVSGRGGPLQREWQAACGKTMTDPPAAVAGRRAAQLGVAAQTPPTTASWRSAPAASASREGRSTLQSSGGGIHRLVEGRQLARLGEVRPCTEAHASKYCGDLVCEGPEEDLVSCPTDCPGVTTAPVCGEEPHSDTGGAAVVFGINHRAVSAQDCCDLCRAHATKARVHKAQGRGRRTPCNSWVFCPLPICWRLDTGWNHTHGECWLKHQPDPAHPLYGQRGAYTPEFRRKHRHVRTSAPTYVPWTGGVIGCAPSPALHSASLPLLLAPARSTRGDDPPRVPHPPFPSCGRGTVDLSVRWTTGLEGMRSTSGEELTNWRAWEPAGTYEERLAKRLSRGHGG